jgi:hypothetical protein
MGGDAQGADGPASLRVVSIPDNFFRVNHNIRPAFSVVEAKAS